MKLVARLISPLILSTCVAACGEPAPEDNPAVESASPPAAVAEVENTLPEKAPETQPVVDDGIPPASALGQLRTGDLDVMEEHRVVRVLTVYSVGRYYLDGPEEKGLVYEMFKRFENDLNDSLKRGHLRVHVVFIPVARDQLIPALLEGRGDVIAAGLSITGERQAVVNFTDPVSKPITEILITGPSAPALDSIDDLSGKTIYLRASSSYRESVEELNKRFVDQGRPPVIVEHISELLEDDDLIEMVNAGLLPWAIVDHYKTQLWDGVFNKLVVRDDIVFRSGARIAWAFRKDSPLLESALNKFVDKNRQGTLIGNILANRYIRDFDWAANALDKDQYKRFEDLVNLFQTYGEQYGVDFLIAAAQGFQESRLDQSVRSSAGAVGVMQLLPSTASDSKVGIDNIEEVEPNIHAGIKYLQYLRKRYFSDPEIDDLNRTLLALGAYNAGPARMIKLRAKAEKMGYDPNVWFDNVEIAAAKDIGRETVQYVANIYKYYLAYKLAMEQQLQRKKARDKAGIK